MRVGTLESLASAVVAVNMVQHEPVRRWPAVVLFQASGLLYIGWQVLLVLVSLTKICRGATGGWVVTTRCDDRISLLPHE